jgi:hypothetical protein
MDEKNELQILCPRVLIDKLKVFVYARRPNCCAYLLNLRLFERGIVFNQIMYAALLKLLSNELWPVSRQVSKKMKYSNALDGDKALLSKALCTIHEPKANAHITYLNRPQSFPPNFFPIHETGGHTCIFPHSLRHYARIMQLIEYKLLRCRESLLSHYTNRLLN